MSTKHSENKEHTPKNAKIAKLMTPKLTAVSDRTKMLDREAIFTIAATVTSLTYDINDLTLSVTTLRRARTENRKKLTEKDKQEFNLNMPLVHWNWKFLPDVTNVVHEKVDHLAMLVTGEDSEKLLGVPKKSKGTGAAMAEATVPNLMEWGIKEQVIGMCFDTTSSNSVIHTGACTLIKKLLQKELLYLACRHHISEIIMSDIFKSCFGLTSSPDVFTFKRYKEQ